MIYLIPLLRARVLNHNPRVKSLQFKNRSGKIQWLPNCQGCPRESLEDGVSLVLMRLSIWASVWWALLSQPLFSMARWSVNCDLFVLPMGGVRAKQRNVKITIGGDSFSGFKNPAPFWISLNFVVPLNFFFLLSSARVGTTYWARSKACLWLTTAQIPRGLTGLSSRARS